MTLLTSKLKIIIQFSKTQEPKALICCSHYSTEFAHKLFTPNPRFVYSQCLMGGQSLGAAYSPSQGFKITYNYFVASKKTTGSLPTTDALCNTPAGTSIMSPG